MNGIPTPPTSQAADEALLAGLRQGEPEAFERLLRTHGGALLATARRLLRNEEDARDAVQEAFLAAFRKVGEFRGQSSLLTWLRRITANAALMKRRSLASRPADSIEELLPEFTDTGLFDEHPSAWVDPFARAEREDLRRVVHECMDRLPDTYRDVLLLRDIEQLGGAEAAEILGISPNAVKVRLHRARQALRSLLAPHLGETES